MSTRDYIPSSERDRVAWLNHFAAWMTTYGAAHGFTPAEIAEVVAAAADAEAAYNDSITAQAASRAAVVTKQHKISDAISLARDDVKRLQADPNTTDGDRAEAGITVPDTIKTPSSPMDVHEVPSPGFYLDFGRRHEVTVHVGLNPHNEHENARPSCAVGAMVQYHLGGIPENEDDWVNLSIVTDSPYVHTIHESQPTTIAYRACWVGKKMNLGPYGDPAVCTVSV